MSLVLIRTCKYFVLLFNKCDNIYKRCNASKKVVRSFMNGHVYIPYYELQFIRFLKIRCSLRLVGRMHSWIKEKKFLNKEMEGHISYNSNVVCVWIIKEIIK